MTSYSTFGVGTIDYVDGGLSSDPDRRDDQYTQIILCLQAGACRALLNAARDAQDEERLVAAEQWQSPVEGWEVDAITSEDRDELRRLVERFARENLHDVIGLAEYIAWGPKTREQLWHSNSGMGMYRVGMLLGETLAGTGVTFLDYAFTEAGMGPDRLWRWVEDQGRDVWHFEDVWIDSAEEPCLLHLKP